MLVQQSRKRRWRPNGEAWLGTEPLRHPRLVAMIVIVALVSLSTSGTSHGRVHIRIRRSGRIVVLAMAASLVINVVLIAIHRVTRTICKALRNVNDGQKGKAQSFLP